MKVHFAGPLFTLFERLGNRDLARRIKALMPELQIDLPQDFENHEKLDLNTDPTDAFHKAIYAECIRGIHAADVVVANLDGVDPDSGTVYEVGYAMGIQKPVIGIRTDFRENQEKGLNIMLSRGVTCLIEYQSFDENPDALAMKIVDAIKRM